jgi:hypothetical protein
VAAGAEFINKHKLIQRDMPEPLEPHGPRRLHVRPFLFGGVDRLFFKGSFNLSAARNTVGTLTLVHKASASSWSVMSGRLAINSAKSDKSSWFNLKLSGRLSGRGSNKPVSRRR